MTGTQSFVSYGAIVLVLLYFLLAGGDSFLRKLVTVLPLLSDKIRAVEIARQTERAISRYLLTICIINVGLGITVGSVLWMLGMPNAPMWGAVAGSLNFIPFLGPVISTLLVGAAAILSFDTLQGFLMPPLACASLTIFEGLLITPALLGRNLTLSPVVIFLSVHTLLGLGHPRGSHGRAHSGHDQDRLRRSRSVASTRNHDGSGGTNVRRLLATICAAFLMASGGLALAQEEQIDTAFDSRRDRAIEERLETLLSNVERLAPVDVSVREGIVTLQGRVPLAEDRIRAAEIADKIEGVALVRNEIEIDQTLQVRLAPVIERLRERVYEFLAWLPLLGVGLVIFVFFWAIARWVGSWERPFRRLSPNPLLRDVLRQAARIGILLLGALLTLEVLDATTLVGAVLGTAGVAGLALGFAFRNVVENYLAGILLSLRQPFAPLDHVVIGPHEGKIVRLTSRATLLMTLDGNHLNVPNSVVFREAVLNYTRNPERRFDFGVGVGMQENLVDVQRLGARILREMEGVLSDPEPFSRIEPLGDFSVTVRLYGWVNQERHDFSKVSSEAIRLVKRAFDEAEIDMPEPIQRIRLDDGTKVAPRKVESAEQMNVDADSDLDERIERERAADGGDDLLAETGHGE